MIAMLIRRSLPARSFGAVLALWFSVFSTEPAALHVCAMHSGHGAGTATAAVAAPAQHNHGQHMAAAEKAPAPPHDSGAQCTCPGGCCAATSVAIPESGAEFTVEVAEPESRPSTAIVSVRATVVDFALPFANGPPPLV
jgi:hypothetical protein